ncbi:MAG: hypothetical protein KBT22_11815 [Bacteroidales bacterium]|nr:hypothetical protein [Candidatus Scybalocola fimicaballi]
MKKTILCAFALLSLNASAATRNMIIEQKDGNKITVDVETIKQISYAYELDGGVSMTGEKGSISYVDLGLSVNWACYNLNASSPEDKGQYRSWGEKQGGKSTFTKDTYNKGLGDVVLDDKGYLTGDSDPYQKMNGDGWRMPTRDDFKELFSKTTIEFVADFNGTGVAGFLFTSKKNQNTLFLPFGWPKDDEPNADNNYDEYYGAYWTADNCYSFVIAQLGTDNMIYDFDYMKDSEYQGMMLRGVFNK